MNQQVDQVIFQCVGMFGALISAVALATMRHNDVRSQGMFFFGACITLFCLMRRQKG